MKKIMLSLFLLMSTTLIGCSKQERISDEITSKTVYELIPLSDSEKANINNITCNNSEGDINLNDVRQLVFYYPHTISDASILTITFLSPRAENEGKVSKEIYNNTCTIENKTANTTPNEDQERTVSSYYYLNGESEASFLESIQNSNVYAYLIDTQREEKFPQYHLSDFSMQVTTEDK